MSIYIETSRLYIREVLDEDLHGMFEMDSDPQVHRYINQKPVRTVDEMNGVIHFIRKQYAINGIGRWAVIDKSTDEFLGWTGFKLMTEYVNGHFNHYDFGYRLKQSAWGRGIATEAGRAALRYGLEMLQLKPVYAMTDVNNAASRHILKKLGFRFKSIFKYDGPYDGPIPDNKMATWYEWPAHSAGI
jgi:RimJ/RimL family protein N-acetyltransferase